MPPRSSLTTQLAMQKLLTLDTEIEQRAAELSLMRAERRSLLLIAGEAYREHKQAMLRNAPPASVTPRVTPVFTAEPEQDFDPDDCPDEPDFSAAPALPMPASKTLEFDEDLQAKLDAIFED